MPARVAMRMDGADEVNKACPDIIDGCVDAKSDETKRGGSGQRG